MFLTPTMGDLETKDSHMGDLDGRVDGGDLQPQRPECLRLPSTSGSSGIYTQGHDLNLRTQAESRVTAVSLSQTQSEGELVELSYTSGEVSHLLVCYVLPIYLCMYFSGPCSLSLALTELN